MLYIVYMLIINRNYMFIKSESSQRVFWKSYERDKYDFSSGRCCIKRYVHRVLIGFVWCVVRRELAISLTLLIRGANFCESKSRMYHINVSSLVRVNWCRLLYISPIEMRLFIRVMMVVRDISYICVDVENCNRGQKWWLWWKVARTIDWPARCTTTLSYKDKEQ